MSSQKKGIIFLFALLLLPSPVFAATFGSSINVTKLYNSYWAIIDLALYFALFLGITVVALKKAMSGHDQAGVTKIAVVLSIVLSALMLFGEMLAGKKLAQFSPWAILMLAFILAFIIFKLFRGLCDGMNAVVAWVIPVLLGFLTFLMILSFFSKALKGFKYLPSLDFLGDLFGLFLLILVLLALGWLIFFLASKFGVGGGAGTDLGPINNRITTLENNINQRFQAIDQSLTQLGQRIEGLDTAINEIRTLIQNIEARLDQWEERFREISTRLEQVEQQIRNGQPISDADMQRIQEMINRNIQGFNDLVTQIETNMNTRLQSIEAEIERIRQTLDDVNRAVGQNTGAIQQLNSILEELSRVVGNIQGANDAERARLIQEIASLNAAILVIRQEMAQLVSSLTAEINKIANKRTKTTLTKENIKEMIKELTSASTSISKTLTPGAPININLIVQGVQQIGRSKQQSLPRIAAEAGIIVGQEDKANVEIICERTAKIKGDTERVQKKQQEISDSIKKIQQMQKKVFEETNKIIISEQKYMDLEYTYAQSMLDVAKTLENESLDIRILQRKKQPDLAKIDLARKNLEKTKEQLLRLIRREGRRQWRGDRRAGPEKIKSHIRTLGNRVILSDVSGILDKIKISEESIMVFCQRDLPNMVSSTNPDWIRIRKTIQEIVEGGNRLRYVPSSFPSWSALLKQLESSINRFNK